MKSVTEAKIYAKRTLKTGIMQDLIIFYRWLQDGSFHYGPRAYFKKLWMLNSSGSKTPVWQDANTSTLSELRYW